MIPLGKETRADICDHAFCFDCIFKRIRITGKKQCPTCKKKIEYILFCNSRGDWKMEYAIAHVGMTGYRETDYYDDLSEYEDDGNCQTCRKRISARNYLNQKEIPRNMNSATTCIECN